MHLHAGVIPWVCMHVCIIESCSFYMNHCATLWTCLSQLFTTFHCKRNSQKRGMLIEETKADRGETTLICRKPHGSLAGASSERVAVRPIGALIHKSSTN